MDAGKNHAVVVADREPLFLSAMCAALADLPGLHVASAVCGGRELLDQIKAVQPRVAVIGFVLACERDALGMIAEIRAASPGLSLVVILPAGGGFLAHRLGSLGVAGILSRLTTPEALREAVRTVSEGGTFMQLDGRHPRPGSTAGEFAVHKLSARELEVFRHLGAGRSYKNIAALLGISPRTVEAHRSQIKTKLGIANAESLTLAASAYSFWESTGIDYLI